MIRSIAGTLRRTVAAPLVQPARMARVGAARALSTSSPLLSSSRPDVPNPSQTDQGSTGPGQSQPASGPSGTVPDRTLSDPYPLPFSPDIVDLNNADSGPESGPQSKWAGVNLASDRQTLDDVDAPMRVPGRETEDRTTKIARLVYQCRKRGTLETDLLLSTFAKKELKNLPNEELDEFDRLLDEPDWDIFYWCTLRKPIPERWNNSFHTEGKLGHRLIQHTKNEEKAVRWMPEL
ncbi:pyruvate dehydrogenase E1, beta subunit [Moesziomyces antarcticus T-34]|uniref:Succinate dehydrogenase assembly factor 2, mitochondrial n=1 Tax=Pseudozyma antarctica (strain T-34) TaxID=1151754 RepID=M9M0B1_PSEA3|nr:pyruvate dehydrogenase E1, beta subunit [Moesziomyces antarcticus T-34]